MPASLANRVRGEQIPVNGVHLRLLEVIVDEKRNPLWRARCLQTGKLLTLALDGLVQVPVSGSGSGPAPGSEINYLAERRRWRRARRWKLILWSLFIAFLAFLLRDQLAALAQSLRGLYESGHLPGLPQPQ